MYAEKNFTSKSKKTDPAIDAVQNLSITLNPFGEVVTSLKIDKINQFLNKNLEDKKLGNKVDMD